MIIVVNNKDDAGHSITYLCKKYLLSHNIMLIWISFYIKKYMLRNKSKRWFMTIKPLY